jgi:hypothetical protein
MQKLSSEIKPLERTLVLHQVADQNFPEVTANFLEEFQPHNVYSMLASALPKPD